MTREDEAFELLKQAFPDKHIILCIDDDNDLGFISFEGRSADLAAITAALVIDLAEKAVRGTGKDPRDFIKTFIDGLEAAQKWAWDLQNDSES